MSLERPLPTEHSAYFGNYIALVTEDDVLSLLAKQSSQIAAILAQVSEESSLFRYAPEKWSIRELLGHVIDAERVFAYRALCIARGEVKSLPGFEEDEYARNSCHHERLLSSLIEEFSLTRKSSLALLMHLSPAAWMRKGTANDQPVSTRALAYIMAGHVRHHLKVLQERYAAALGKGAVI